MSLSRRSFLRFLGLGAVAAPVIARTFTDLKAAPPRLVTWSAKVKGPALPNNDVTMSFQREIIQKIWIENPYANLIDLTHYPRETP